MDIHQYIDPLLHFFTQHKALGSVATFVIAFLEALPIIGTIITGSVTMTIIGIMVGTGILNGYLIFALACIGAYAGDWVGFSFGYYFQDRISNMWPFKNHPKWLQSGQDFFDKHGMKSVIIGRFFGPIRSTVPMVAGILNMPWIQFFFAAIPAAIIWATFYMGPGIILGQVALELSPMATTKIILYGLIFIMITWFIFWFIEHFFLQITKAIQYGIESLWQPLLASRWTRPFTRLIQHHNNPQSAQPLGLLLLSFVILTVLGILCHFIAQYGPHNSINLATSFLMKGFRNPHVDTIDILFTNVG